MVPEQSYWPIYIGLGVLVSVIVILGLFFVFVWLKEKENNRKNNIRYQRFIALLHSVHVHLWTYDVKNRLFVWQNYNGNTARTYSPMALSKRYPIKDFEHLRDELESIIKGKATTGSVLLRAKDEETEERDYVVNMMPATHGSDRTPNIIVGAEIDITESKSRQKAASDMMLRYQSVFNIAMTDMALYDADGYLVDFNQKVCETFNGTFESIKAQHLNLSSMLQMTPEEVRNIEYFHATLIDRYVKELDDFVVTDYINNINYLLQVGGVRIAEYAPDIHMLTIFKGINEVQLSLTQARCMTLLDNSAKNRAMRLLNSMDSRTTKPISVELKTTLRSKNRLPLFLQMHFIPVLDASGQVTKYFGLCRDVSEVKETERQLEIESINAQDEENIKNVFLRNMSYEIRTPLASVVGFAELFDMPHDAEEEPMFIEQIKSNSSYLLTLINEILFLSRLDAKMIEFKPQPTDIAAVFDAHCQNAWNNFKKPNVEYVVENHYKKMEVVIDDGHLSTIIGHIASNAAQHTNEGRVCARYDYIHGHLIVTIEDTGNGIESSSLPHIFERFASKTKNGTGLGLPICKELTEQMGGSFEINSELGRGTTVWISIPCQVLNIERKDRL